ncbi:MAG: DUF3237 domain-containing protein [Alphaproteobacteria bacterium]|nr:DUF3237 domain-containing protein [Alphaproteobacteria bacterium]
MTLYAPVDPPKPIDPTLVIYLVRAGGWVAGPKIKGTLAAPTADWLRIMPGGVSRIDARGLIETDDGALISLTFGGVVHFEPEALERLNRGEVVRSGGFYSITTPFQTNAPSYAWLNRMQAVGKLIEADAGAGAHVTYDIFAVS